MDQSKPPKWTNVKPAATLAGPCHPKQRGFLAEEISGRDRNGHAVDLLKRPMAGGVPHGADADHRGVGVGMRPWIPVVDDAFQRIAARLEYLQALIGNSSRYPIC